MTVDDFDFTLPENLIAQTPLKERDASKLLVLDKDTGLIQHRHFKDIVDYLKKDDVLVINDTKVIPARLYGVKEDTEALIEILMLKDLTDDKWECLVKPAKRIKEGTIVNFSDKLKAKCIEVQNEGIRIFKFVYDGIFLEILDELGTMPLPPYIHEKLQDQNRYQTVYAKYTGSIAAPTAGFHFTPELLQKLKDKGVKICYITLHVGWGTFKPLRGEPEQHHMLAELGEVSPETADTLNAVRAAGKRVFSCGTTSTRTLESFTDEKHITRPGKKWTDLFIYPGYKFKAIDCLITNFHFPDSTPLCMTSAFAGEDFIYEAYLQAVEKKYRFYSFGDSMMIL